MWSVRMRSGQRRRSAHATTHNKTDYFYACTFDLLISKATTQSPYPWPQSTLTFILLALYTLYITAAVWIKWSLCYIIKQTVKNHSQLESARRRISISLPESWNTAGRHLWNRVYELLRLLPEPWPHFLCGSGIIISHYSKIIVALILLAILC